MELSPPNPAAWMEQVPRGRYPDVRAPLPSFLRNALQGKQVRLVNNASAAAPCSGDHTAGQATRAPDRKLDDRASCLSSAGSRLLHLVLATGQPVFVLRPVKRFCRPWERNAVVLAVAY
jgi:hypothetical protein